MDPEFTYLTTVLFSVRCVQMWVCVYVCIWGGYVVEEMGLAGESAMHTLTIPCLTSVFSLVPKRKGKKSNLVVPRERGAGAVGFHKIKPQYMTLIWAEFGIFSVEKGKRVRGLENILSKGTGMERT